MIAPARRVAYRILNQIATADARSDELLHTPEVDALSPQDRHLVTTLVLGVLRWQLTLDAQIRALLARPDAKLSADVAIALRLGAFQLLHLDRVPAHAVLNDSVELVKQTADHGASGMVNAILRKIAAQGKFVPPAALRSAREVAGAWGHPQWMVERWARRFGVETATAICRWDQEPAEVTLRLDSTVAELPGVEVEPGAFLAQARRVVQGDVRSGDALQAGRVRIQDEASQLVAEIAAASAPAAGRVLDTCAAPGGKTAILAERLPDAEITALDVSRKRLDFMRRNFPGKYASHVRFEAGDAAMLQLQPEYDLILCDVPCSGTGTMARNPEIRLRLDEADLRRQNTRQTAILRAALPGLKPGGRLLYSTCSLEREENEEVVETVLRDQPGFRLLPVGGLIEQLAETGIVTPAGRNLPHDIVDGNFLRIIPGLHPCDGFFAAVLQRD
ncbi:MAG TPA: transcription antitermination factor NusB [Acidobacteriaceae bacterium]|jgi:16S rRNA (cytosine967-C5)-methyltransferase|nr:transcription antitermination factor NusB [Acidobacteriaceae bacterium]